MTQQIKQKLRYSYFFNLKDLGVCRYGKLWIQKGIDHMPYLFDDDKKKLVFVSQTKIVCARENDFHQPWEFQKPQLSKWRGAIVKPATTASKKILANLGMRFGDEFEVLSDQPFSNLVTIIRKDTTNPIDSIIVPVFVIEPA